MPETITPTMNDEQRAALKELCSRYHVPFVEGTFHTRFDLPAGYFAGWVGPIYCGVSPEGSISS